ncbi:MAG: fumarate hydratase [Dehalococcoidia bacterium]|jgi:fumarate hydratase subunit alpha
MREIAAKDITKAVTRLCKEANYFLGEDVLSALKKARDKEESPTAMGVLDQIIENADIAAKEEMPLCQDCGLAIVFVEMGQDAHVTGGDLYEAIHEGVRQGYAEGYLRKSVVKQPFSARMNTKDNTPAIVHIEIIKGDKIKLTVAPKGGGSENMSRFTVLKPAQGRAGVIDFVVKTVDEAGSNPCPPTIIGVGIGGSAEKAMYLAKKSLLRKVGEPSKDKEVAELEAELLQRINATGIGPGGVGGRITSLAVHVETHPAHIASMPVAVNIQCHSARHKEAVL